MKESALLSRADEMVEQDVTSAFGTKLPIRNVCVSVAIGG
jgi:hypothetical protein